MYIYIYTHIQYEPLWIHGHCLRFATARRPVSSRHSPPRNQDRARLLEVLDPELCLSEARRATKHGRKLGPLTVG